MANCPAKKRRVSAFSFHSATAPVQAVVFEDPDGVMIELIQLPSADEIRRVREASRVERPQPTA
jgi:hypothetical protein